jgi:hypothetical protein
MRKQFTMIEIVREVSTRMGCENGATVALYPSAGADSQVFTFTHPSFLKKRGVRDFPKISLYVLLDDQSCAVPLTFKDDSTQIVLEGEVEEIDVHGFEAFLYRMKYLSKRYRKPHGFMVLQIRCRNRDFAAVAHPEWMPEVCIGVCDGCVFGGNDHCVNDISCRALKGARTSEWYITDHFSGAHIPNPLSPGGFVTSKDPEFPFVFEKRALLSSNWGGYGDWSCMKGAALFRVRDKKFLLY